MRPQDGSPLCYLVAPLMPGATDADLVALLRAVLDECDRRDVQPGNDRLLRALLAYGVLPDTDPAPVRNLDDEELPPLTYGGFETP